MMTYRYYSNNTMSLLCVTLLILASSLTEVVYGDETSTSPPTPTPSSSSSSTDNLEICNDLIQQFTICLFEADPNADFEGDDSMVDDTACAKCYIDLYDKDNLDGSLSCSEATNNVCTFFDDCQTVCFPKHTVCIEEAYAYYACAFGSVFAPPGCLVSCDGTVPDGNGNGNGGDGNGGSGGGGGGGGSNMDSKGEQDDMDAVSGVASATALTLSGMTAMALVVAGLTL